MKNRKAYYSPIDNKDEEKIFEFKGENGKSKVSGLNKKYFDKKDRKKIAGYVHLKNKRSSCKEYASLHDAVVDSEIDIYSKKKFYERVTGYVKTTDGEYIAVTKNYLALLILFLVCLGLCVGFYVWNLNNKDDTPMPPDFSEVVEEDDDNQYDLTARVILPEGKTEFDGTIFVPKDEKERLDNPDYPGEVYEGDATVKVTLMVDGSEHILLETQKVKIQKGELPDVYIDFTKLDFELKSGIYVGKVIITYPDGAIVEKPIQIVISDSSQGTIGIGYSNKVYVYKDQDKISMKYYCGESTDYTIAQIIIKNDDSEILLGQSGIVKSGQTIKEIKLNSDTKGKIKKGAYKGVMRIYLDTRNSANADTDVKTDIEVTIFVK